MRAAGRPRTATVAGEVLIARKRSVVTGIVGGIKIAPPAPETPSPPKAWLAKNVVLVTVDEPRC